MQRQACIWLSPVDRVTLDGWVADRNTPQKLVWRARIVLMSAASDGTMAIVRALGKSKRTVGRWQERYLAQGIEGLRRDASRPGRKPPLSAALIQRVVEMTLHETAPGATHWSVRSMCANFWDIRAFGAVMTTGVNAGQVRGQQRNNARQRGGGGSGRGGAASTDRRGGGGAGGLNRAEWLASDIGASLTVTIGVGGTACPAISVDNINGTAGGVGGDTFISDRATEIRGTGGDAGGAGGTAAATAGGVGGYGDGGLGNAGGVARCHRGDRAAMDQVLTVRRRIKRDDRFAKRLFDRVEPVPVRLSA